MDENEIRKHNLEQKNHQMNKFSESDDSPKPVIQQKAQKNIPNPVVDRIVVSDNVFVQGQLEITRSRYSSDSIPVSKGPIPAGYRFADNIWTEESAMVLVSMEGAYDAAFTKAYKDIVATLRKNSWDGAFNLDIQQQIEMSAANRMDVFLYCDACKRII